MTDPRVQKLAQVLVYYSLNLQPGEDFSMSTTPLADELSLAVYEEAIKAGANVLVQNQLPGFEEIFYKLGNGDQIQYIKIVKEKAAKGEDFLTALLNTDPGSRYLGEWGIGTNYQIPRFTKNMLFDEKLGGTIHLRWAGRSQKSAARTNPAYTGICYAIWLRVKFMWMASCFTKTVNLQFEPSLRWSSF